MPPSLLTSQSRVRPIASSKIKGRPTGSSGPYAHYTLIQLMIYGMGVTVVISLRYIFGYHVGRVKREEGGDDRHVCQLWTTRSLNPGWGGPHLAVIFLPTITTSAIFSFLWAAWACPVRTTYSKKHIIIQTMYNLISKRGSLIPLLIYFF